MQEQIQAMLTEAAKVKSQVAEDQNMITGLSEVAAKLIEVVEQGGSIYACGNGGSACDAMHLVEELTARYKRDRKGIRAMHFMDPAMITCWSNDYDYQTAFKRYADTFCTDKDLLFGFSTSGNSENVLEAVKLAKQKGTYCVGMTGKGGGQLAEHVDCNLLVPSDQTERIQELHITFVHILCELIETNLVDLLEVKS